ncbi:polyribonucleotide nucleotidyltransferase [Aphanomyces invadans]|uniref:polyribonucleotide nucleotidyltransferase n=1 Tax=Aphanomyces invadans TaxID=157072 RepID=A0A024U4K6_9STRA|nr:polyribonucleotide nucleotidyltransferase [Aphanomyces invadans]ETW01184.1 polyribonucleotide nucleotidyltransferase [Aphanomyces invadans]|eukprot:XP_008870182.1 polyribonucleotide nucleotidyltransferase [Aphanomyces invadans]
MLRLPGRRAAMLARVRRPLLQERLMVCQVEPHQTIRMVAPLQQRTFFNWLGREKEKEHIAPTAPVDAPDAAIDDTLTQVATRATKIEEFLTQKQANIDYSLGKFAPLADGSVMARWGNSMVLTTVVSAHATDPAADFLPLMVDYREKFSSTGTIPGTFKRREMGSDAEVLKSRVIDRIVRPLFPKGYSFETQILATVQSFDVDHDPVVLAVNSTSAALMSSNIPWNGPIGCVRVVQVGDDLIVHPTADEVKAATLDLLYAGTAHRTMMIEAEGHQVPDAIVQEALRLAHRHIQPLIEAQLSLPQKTKREFSPLEIPPDMTAMAATLRSDIRALLGSFQQTNNSKKDRQALESKCYNVIKDKLVAAFPAYTKESPVVNSVAHDLIQDALRSNALAGIRLDGRPDTAVRSLDMETSVLPMAHGSALFSRGYTSALCTVTLGSLDLAMRVRSALTDNDKFESKRAFLQYEFPPYCVNEIGKLGAPNRRMIGHGALAEKAILPVLPPLAQLPNAIRMTSETQGSDGSSSMATVCGVSLALLDAGVPITAPVAGISIGLVSGGDLTDGISPIEEYRLLTDILGTEDHYFDMDFKIAGTANGMTAMQLDVKLPGVPVEILCESIERASSARGHVLTEMGKVRVEPRAIPLPSIGSSIIHHVTYDPSMRGVLIGSGGGTIRELETQSNCAIHCKEGGLAEIIGKTEEDVALATRLVQEITFVYRRNQRYNVVVQTVMDFGCIVVPEFAYGTPQALEKSKQAFLHVTEMAHTPVKRANLAVKPGQVLECWCIFAERDMTKLSMKALVDPDTNKALTDAEAIDQQVKLEEALKRNRMT